jgi:hypothetical protein
MLICKVCTFNKHVAIKWTPCAALTDIILLARVAGSNSGVLLDVAQSILESVFGNVCSEAISLKG